MPEVSPLVRCHASGSSPEVRAIFAPGDAGVKHEPLLHLPSPTDEVLQEG